MLASQLSSRGRAADFVLYHRITPDLEVCIDSKTYGNDSRFCRRADTKATEFNAEVSKLLKKLVKFLFQYNLMKYGTVTNNFFFVILNIKY